MVTESRVPSGEWNGFYLESIQPSRGWMHLYLSFENGELKGEGTDYVGPWVAQGRYDVDKSTASWTKQYLGKHKVDYSGKITEQGIVGTWKIQFMTGEFHIWPRGMNHLNELYLREDLQQPQDTTIPLGTVLANDREIFV